VHRWPREEPTSKSKATNLPADSEIQRHTERILFAEKNRNVAVFLGLNPTVIRFQKTAVHVGLPYQTFISSLLREQTPVAVRLRR